MTTNVCACISPDEIECAELRWYGYYPALDQRTEGLAECCGCACHTNWNDDE